MGEMKDNGYIYQWSTRIAKELPDGKRIPYNIQSEKLKGVLPSFTYQRLRALRSNPRYKEQPNEILAFKTAFANEIAYLEDADTESNKKEEQLKKIEELEAKVKQGEDIREFLAKNLQTQTEILEMAKKLEKMIEDIKKGKE